MSVETFIEWVIKLGAFFGAVGGLYVLLSKAISNMLTDKFKDVKTDNEATNKKIDDLKVDINKRFENTDNKIDESAVEACKNFLTHSLTDIQNAPEGEVDEVLKKRVHDSHDWYKEHGQNSYIDSRFNELVKKGKL